MFHANFASISISLLGLRPDFEKNFLHTLVSAGGFGRIQRALGPFRRVLGGGAGPCVDYTKKTGEKDAARRLNENNKKSAGTAKLNKQIS